ncbi:hypothetical protein CC1G_03843 [Coprinopsis cinerea okayama7|uniref:NYN domain-containing protein n=1 Tax=Coprinopsis cinerea (strain Okayama-7 / 130 / ATCC MYA-4618 / FGSC 9003) TaxID=240176 RepID=A8NGX9_COPC7|nr:hypothetical protein CC1G_03843 [Coprinopsis cinerea okayama7\|eukprot:XP_001833626.1 hypothetical protein CC1G_03843 [Coprinopsis cinerea okayama7\
MNDSGFVSVYWDMTASAHPTVTGFDITNAIRKLLKPLGIIQLFKFYVDLSHPAAPSGNLKSELQCSGVTVVDTASNGRPNASNKMMIADCIVQALNLPPPHTYALISGDMDILYAASLLRMRGYNVAILCPAASEQILLAEADWNDSHHRLFRRVFDNGPELTQCGAPSYQSQTGSDGPTYEVPVTSHLGPLSTLQQTHAATNHHHPSIVEEESPLPTSGLTRPQDPSVSPAPLSVASASLPTLNAQDLPTLPSDSSTLVSTRATSPPGPKSVETSSIGQSSQATSSTLDPSAKVFAPSFAFSIPGRSASAPPKDALFTQEFGQERDSVEPEPAWTTSGQQSDSNGTSAFSIWVSNPTSSASTQLALYLELPLKYRVLVDCLRSSPSYSIPRNGIDGAMRKIDPNYRINSGMDPVPQPIVKLIEGAYEEGIITSKTGSHITLTPRYR